jgi:NitT/TauT family transport system substrate-binding protein
MLKKIIVTIVCIIIAAGLILFKFYPQVTKSPAAPPEPAKKQADSGGYASDKVVEPSEIPNLGPAGTYKMNGDTVDVELSVWPGYAPLIVANGGLSPNPDSFFFKKYGFKLKIVLSEGEAESWQALNSGKTAVSATTVDVLALYGNQLKIEVPIQLDFSRGGDGILVSKEITTINQLKGKIVTVAQFTESDFFLRFLAQEAGLKVKSLKGVGDAIDPESVNLLFTESAFDAADVFVDSVTRGDKYISGAVTWSPKTVEIPADLPDKVRLLATNRNMLVVADIVVVNVGFAKESPKIVRGLVEGILTGVDMIGRDPQNTLPIAAKAFSMSIDELKKSIQEVHVSNHAENLAFFTAQPGETGNFNELYYTAVYAYGKEIIANPIAPEKLVNRSYLDAIAQEGLFAGQTVALGPIKTSEKAEVLEKNPLLTKQIRFLFQPNSAELDIADTGNQQALTDLTNLLKFMPGSFILLRGHLDNTKVAEFQAKGDAYYRKMAVRAIEQSKQRAESVKAALLKAAPNVDASRVDTEGRGWDEPLPGARPEDNRRVEVQLFTLE